jgi:phosphopantothenoylcysteine synthetase/decarboxylase
MGAPHGMIMKQTSPQRLAVVTCGPAHTSIDGVRLITNVSTGTLGIRLCESLAQQGWQVLCYKGQLATAPFDALPEAVREIPFGTNASLLEALQTLPERESVLAVFHAAALTDFDVESVSGPGGIALPAAKIPSDCSEVLLRLRPAPKLLPELPRLFPNAKIAGWKFELEGSREEAIARARIQITSLHTHLCIVNGTAFGKGFGILTAEGHLEEVPDRRRLAERLAAWAGD